MEGLRENKVKKFLRANKIQLSLFALAAVVSGVALFGFLSTKSEAIPRDCDNNAIIKCGSETESELISDYKANKSELSKIYNHYGISESDITGKKAEMGRVYKDGRVKVGSKVVATNAYSIGRHDIGNSSKLKIGGKTYYERSTKTSFAADSISAFVFFDANGDFKAAILTSCGNPVRATKPVYECKDLNQAAIVGSRNRFKFTTEASAKNGAVISSYNYDFGDGKTAKSSSKTVEHAYDKPGTYTVKVSVKVKINNTHYNDTKYSEKCSVKVTVTEPTYACKGLAHEQITRTEHKFTATAQAANGAKVTGYKYDFGDGTVKENASATETHTYDKAGEYTVKVWAIVTIDGKQVKEVTDAKCEVKVTVNKEPIYTCDYLKKNMISRTEFTFTGEATAENGPEIVNYTIDFGDGTSAEVTDPTDVPHEYTQPGTYTAKMTANMMVNGEATPVTGEACEVEVTVTPPNKVEVCNPETGETIVVDEDEADNYVPVGDPACEPVKVCNPETGEIITVDKKDEDKYKPVGDPACEEKPEECKPGIPVNDERCEEIPAELPTTGPAEMIGGALGLGSIVAAGYYWYASRRGLMNEMLNR